MPEDYSSKTSLTLIIRLGDADDREAWEAFVERYTPRIYAWCRRFRLQESDAADVTQEVLCKLIGAMRSAKYDPARGSFRAWLKTVTGNTVRDLLTSRRRPERGSGDTRVMKLLASLEDPQALPALAAHLDAEIRSRLALVAPDGVPDQMP